MLGENHRYIGGLGGAGLVMSPRLKVKKTGRDRWARELEDRQTVSAEGRNGICRGDISLRCLIKIISTFIKCLLLYTFHI